MTEQICAELPLVVEKLWHWLYVTSTPEVRIGSRACDQAVQAERPCPTYLRVFQTMVRALVDA